MFSAAEKKVDGKSYSHPRQTDPPAVGLGEYHHYPYRRCTYQPQNGTYRQFVLSEPDVAG